MLALTEVKMALPLSHPNRLLLRAERPPPDSTTERLGSSRQSSLWRSAAFRNSSAKSWAGQSMDLKNFFKVSRRGSLRYSALASGNSALVTDTGTVSIPAMTNPLESSFIIMRLHSLHTKRLEFLLLTRSRRMKQDQMQAREQRNIKQPN